MNGKRDFFPIPNRKTISIKEALHDVISKTYSNDNPKNNFKLIASKRILNPNNPSHTIVKKINACGINPLTNTYFSIEELKALSTFLPSFMFIGSAHIQAYLIGNAVPPKFIEAIATKTMLNLKEMGVIKEEYTVLSLFAGCGGSSLGYKMAGFKELLAIDFDKHAVETFKLNFKEVPIWQRDITQIRGEEILKFCNIKEGELDVLDGSPPCQGFSTAGKRKVYDKRNDLVLEYIRLVDELQPKVFVMENVSGIVKGTMKGLFKEYMLKMKALNYVVKCKLMNAKYYNVPQSRERLIWIGVRKDLEKDEVFPKGNRKIISVEEALHDTKPNNFIPPCKGQINAVKRCKSNEKLSKYHKKGYWYSYARLPKYAPSFCIPKQHAFHVYHYDETRCIDINELLILFSFPSKFKTIGSYNKQWQAIGNSVPPNFMYAIAKIIKERILT